MHDPYNLNRFLSAQAPVIEQVREELRAAAQNREFRRLSIAEP
jgi:uncharacterized protein (DUF1810 family)